MPVSDSARPLLTPMVVKTTMSAAFRSILNNLQVQVHSPHNHFGTCDSEYLGGQLAHGEYCTGACVRPVQLSEGPASVSIIPTVAENGRIMHQFRTLGRTGQALPRSF